MINKISKQYLTNAKRQRFWASLALRDERYAKAQTKRLLARHLNISAKDFRQEARNDKIWANKRIRLAQQYEKKAKRGI